MNTSILLGLFLLHVVLCRDFYVGMFKKDDLLVASDTLYKERKPFRLAVAMYGRTFKCNITYFRISDRLGMGRGPVVEITRGGLRKNYVVLRITSSYDLPLSVNIYVGCENKYNISYSTYIIRPTRVTRGSTKAKSNGTTETATDNANEAADKPETPKDGGGETTTVAPSDTPATPAEGGETPASDAPPE